MIERDSQKWCEVIEEFKDWVRDNVAPEDRNDCSGAWKEFLKENGYLSSETYPFSNETYYNI